MPISENSADVKRASSIFSGFHCRQFFVVFFLMQKPVREKECEWWTVRPADESQREREREGETKYYQSPSRTDVIMFQHNISASHPLHLIQYLPNICMKQDSENVRNLNFQLLLDHPWLAERIARLSLLGEGKRGVRVG